MWGIFSFSLSSILILLFKLEISGVITLIGFSLFVLILIYKGHLPATSTPMGRPADFRVACPWVGGLRIQGLFRDCTDWNPSIISITSGAGPLRSFAVAT